MKLNEAARKGITRLVLVKDGKPVWNPYSFGDIYVLPDGSIGPWMKVYDPCGQMACGNPPWEPLDVLTIPGVRPMACVEPDDEFEAFVPPADIDRFPGCQKMKEGIPRA